MKLDHEQSVHLMIGMLRDISLYVSPTYHLPNDMKSDAVLEVVRLCQRLVYFHTEYIKELKSETTLNPVVESSCDLKE
jgi:hypothetical protein